jgi:GNAT superfamily N-acetyltransferase
MRRIMTKDQEDGKTPRFECFDHDEDEAARYVAAALGADIDARFPAKNERPLVIVAREADEAIAGLTGVSHWRWLYIRRLWTAPAHRGRGLARRLLAKAEAKAEQRGCVGLYIDTFEEEVARFYERTGFARCGRIEDFPPGGARIFLQKRL